MLSGSKDSISGAVRSGSMAICSGSANSGEVVGLGFDGNAGTSRWAIVSSSDDPFTCEGSMDGG